LPELQHYEPTELRLIERSRRIEAQIIDVARFVALITGAYFFSQDFGQCQAGDFAGTERQESEITLFALWPTLRR